MVLLGPILSLLTSILPLALGQARSATSSDDKVNLTPTIKGRLSEQVCMTGGGKEGKCVDESYCNEQHTILPGGIIDESELREGRSCPRDFEWCCTEPIATPKVVTSKDNECTAPESVECPWCVLLFRSQGVAITKTGLFCMGTMIGPNVVLTAGTCIKSAQKQMLWVRVPSSASPTRNYTVQYRKFHPLYNTGTHFHDFGILVLEKNVDWGKGKWMGACIGLQTPIKGECIALGYDEDENIVPTILTVKEGSCVKGGNVPDAVCGTLYGDDEDDYCFVSTGSPVLCRVQGKQMLVTGVARTSCSRQSQVLLGAISLSSDWLENELKGMALTPKQYRLNGE